MTDPRELNDSDLEGFARRVAIYAREALEAKNKAWIYLPSFRDAVTAEALAMLKIVVLHERQMNKHSPHQTPSSPHLKISKQKQ